jgi:hypothetical protein
MKKKKCDRIMVSEDIVNRTTIVKIYMTVWSRIEFLFTGEKVFKITDKQKIDAERISYERSREKRILF